MSNLPKVVYFADYKEQLQEMLGVEYNNAKEAALILEANKVRYILKSGTTMDANGIYQPCLAIAPPPIFQLDSNLH